MDETTHTHPIPAGDSHTPHTSSLNRRSLLGRAAVATAGLGLGAGISQSASAAPTTGIGKLGRAFQDGGKQVVVNIEDDINSLDPAKGLGTHTLRTVDNMFNSLVETFGDQAEPQPSLATEWSTSPDGLEWTFKLRENVTFHDGTPFDADAVKLSLDRTLFQDNPYYFGPYPFPPFFLGSIKEIQVVDPMTVKFVLKQPDPTFLGNLVWTTGGIVSPTAIKQYGKEVDQHPVGTGPFKYVTWEKGTRIEMAKFENYWGGAPDIDTLIFKPVAEEAARLTQLQKGDLTIAVALSPEFIPDVKEDQNLTLLETPGIHTWFAELNLHQKPLDDVRVRQALNYAIDRDSIVADILQGAATASSSFSYPGTWSYEAQSEIYSYDPDKAKSLLKEAGADSGLKLLYLVPESGSGMIAPKSIGTVMQAMLQDVGVEVEVQTLEWNAYLNEFLSKGMDRPDSGKPQLSLVQMSWMSPVSDPGLYINYYLRSTGPYNSGYYNNPRMDQLLDSAMATVNQDERKGFYSQAQILAANEAPWIFMFHAYNVVATQKNITGFTLNPNMNNMKFNTVKVG